MWTIKWPSDTLRTYIEAFKEFMVDALEAGEAVFVFDIYFKGSTRAYLRTLRHMKEATCRVHVLSEDMPVPSRNVIPRFYTVVSNTTTRLHYYI